MNDPLNPSLPVSLAAAGLSGLLLFLAYPPVGAWPLAFVALVPFLRVARRLRPRAGLLAGFVFGVAFFGSLLYWILLFGKLAWIALVTGLAAYSAVFGLLAPRLWREERPILSSAAIAGLWTFLELVRSTWPVGGVAWGEAAYSQASDPTLLKLASVTGAWGVSFVVVIVNLLLITVWERRGSGRRAPAMAIAGALLLVLAPGLIHIPAPNGRPVDVATVQADIPTGPGSETLSADTRKVGLLAAQYDRLRGAPPDLGIWPEGTLGEDPRLYPEVGAPLAASIRVVDAPTLVGAIIGPPGGAQYNASLLYDGAANVTGIYEKTHLVPFGEYVPFRSLLGGIPQLRQLPTDLTPGPDVHTLAVGGITFGVAICFENSFPEIDRALVREGAGFLVTSINNSSYGHTAASSQHLQMDRFRAVENARWVVHAAVSGVSAFVSPDGRVYDATGLFEPATIRMTLRTSTARTLYTRFGDWFPWFSLLLAFGGLLLPRRRGPAPQAEPLREGARTLVILPTYDERPTIGPVLDRLLALGENVDVFVIDDGSPDGTGDIVAEVAAREPRVRLTRRPRKAGLASAYLLGFKHALEQRYDVAVEMDSDLSHVPEELPRLLAAAGSFDLVIGSRYVPGGSVSNWSRTRVLLSRAGNLYARLCLGLPLRDSTSGFRAYRRPLLEHLITGGIHAEGYGFQIELADRAWRDGYAIAEVPITFREREHGHSKISRRIVVEALWMVTRWGLRERFSPSRRARAERP